MKQVALCLLHLGKLFFRYFIFTSFWAYKIYYVYGFMMLVLVILCIVTVCVTIVCTYFLLNAEDYRWWVRLLNVTVSPFIGELWKVLWAWICSLPGNGQVFSLLRPQLFMFTCTPFTTTSLKQSKFLVYCDLRCTVGILFCVSQTVHIVALKIFPNDYKRNSNCFAQIKYLSLLFFCLGCTGCSRHPSTLATWLCSALL